MQKLRWVLNQYTLQLESIIITTYMDILSISYPVSMVGLPAATAAVSSILSRPVSAPSASKAARSS